MMKNKFNDISYMMIEVNSSCNLKCAFCNREELVKKGWRSPKNMNLVQFEEILKKFDNCKIDTIKLEGISEPMMHPEFDKFAKALRKKFPEAFIIVATNLQYNVGKTKFKETLDYIDMMYLSIDGVEEVYEKARQGSTYKRLLTSLEYIKENISKELRKEKLHINFTLTQENYQTLHKMYDIKQELDLASVRINIAQNWNEEQEINHNFSPDALETLKKYKKNLKGVADWDYNKCFWPFEGIVIDVFGNIRQCIINTSQKPIGNIFETNIEDIYNGQYYKETRSKLKNNCAPESCKTCDYKKIAPLLKDIFKDEIVNSSREFNND